MARCQEQCTADGTVCQVAGQNFYGQYTSSMAKKKDLGRNFDRPFQVRVTSEQLDLFRKAAKAERRSLSNWARYHLEKIANRVLKK